MDLQQLRCFVAAAEDLHFGRAALRLGVSAAVLGQQIRRLERAFDTPLFTRTTRHVALSDAGARILQEARDIVARADALASRMKHQARAQAVRASPLRVGAIDSAAAGLLPLLLQDFRRDHPALSVQLIEDKSIRLLPRLLSGRLDLAFVRPPVHMDKRLACLHLLHETAVVALPSKHRLAARKRLTVADLADEPMIVPERYSRPHSHDLTVKLFAHAGLAPRIAQMADEKQTIVNLVAAGIGIAIVPRWTARMATIGVRFVPLAMFGTHATAQLPLSAAWLRDVRSPVRDRLIATLKAGLPSYVATA